MRIGNLVMLLGSGLLVLGALIRFVPRLFSWFGHLPGDIRVEGDSTRVFIPLTSMILVSVAVTVIANLVAALFRDH